MTLAVGAAAGAGGGAIFGIAAVFHLNSGVARISVVAVGALGGAVASINPTADFIAPVLDRISGGGRRLPKNRPLTICYGGADRVWADWARAALAAEGCKPDVRDVRLLRPAADRRMLLIVSYGFELADGAAKAAVALRDTPPGLAVACVRGCRLPSVLAEEAVILPMGDRGDVARDLLLALLSSHQVVPLDQAADYEPVDVRYPGEYPPICSSLPSPDPAFTGRDDLLHELARILIGEDGDASSVRACALHGMGGIGKTSAAIAFAHRFRGWYDAILRLDAQDGAVLDASLSRLASAELWVSADDADQRMMLFWSALRSRGRSLVIFDNAASQQSLEPWWPTAGCGATILVTSRNPEWTWARPVPVELPSLDEAVRMLCSAANGDDTEGAARVAQALDRLPIALAHAGSYVRRRRLSWTDYGDLVAEQLDKVVETAPPGEVSVAATIEVSLAQVRTHPGAQELLQLYAFLAPRQIPRNLAASYPGTLPDPLRAVAADRGAFTDAVGTLIEYSLVQTSVREVEPAQGEQELFVHVLVQACVRGGLSVSGRRLWAAAAVALLDRAFPLRPAEPASWPECARLLAHVVTAARHAVDLAAALPETADICQRAADYLIAVGAQQRPALDLLDIATELRRRETGPDSAGKLAEALTSRAQVLLNLLRVPDSIKVAEEALSIRKAGQTRPPAAQLPTLRVLADALIERACRGQSAAEAVPLLERGVEISEAIPDGHDERNRTAQILATLGYAFLRLGRLGAARSALKRAVTTWEEAGVHASGGRVVATRRLGTVLLSIGQCEEALGHAGPATQACDAALAQMEEAQRMGVKLFGPDSAQVKRVDDAMGTVLAERGQLGEAETLQRKVKEFFEKTDPMGYVRAGSLTNLARTVLCAGRAAEAVELASESLHRSERRRSPDHPYNAEILVLLGAAQRAAGDVPAAATSLERARALYKAVYEPGYFWLAPLFDELAEVRRAQGDLASARSLAAQARAIRFDAANDFCD